MSRATVSVPGVVDWGMTLGNDCDRLYWDLVIGDAHLVWFDVP